MQKWITRQSLRLLDNKRAPRYEPRQFPFMNLGRIYLKQGKWREALHELEAAVRAAPGDPGAAKALHSLRARLN